MDALGRLNDFYSLIQQKPSPPSNSLFLHRTLLLLPRTANLPRVDLISMFIAAHHSRTEGRGSCKREEGRGRTDSGANGELARHVAVEIGATFASGVHLVRHLRLVHFSHYAIRCRTRGVGFSEALTYVLAWHSALWILR